MQGLYLLYCIMQDRCQLHPLCQCYLIFVHMIFVCCLASLIEEILVDNSCVRFR